MNEVLVLVRKSFNLNIGSFSLPVSYLQAGAVIFLIFLLILTMAQFRRHMVDWSAKGAIFGIFIGFFLALILEGFLIIGGKTALTELLGWKDAPRPIQLALESGREKLINVLGITDEIPETLANSNPTAEDATEVLQSLNPAEMKKVKALICTP